MAEKLAGVIFQSRWIKGLLESARMQRFGRWELIAAAFMLTDHCIFCLPHFISRLYDGNSFL